MNKLIVKLLSLPLVAVLVSIWSSIGLSACTPTVHVQAPDKPIEINLNVNIEQRVKIEIQREVQDAIAKNPDIF